MSHGPERREEIRNKQEAFLESPSARQDALNCVLTFREIAEITEREAGCEVGTTDELVSIYDLHPLEIKRGRVQHLTPLMRPVVATEPGVSMQQRPSCV